MVKQKNIPELRFSEFTGEWEKTTLGELTENFSIRNKKLDEAEVYSITNTNGFVLQTEQFEKRIIAGNDLSNYKVVKKDDFAYNPARINVGSIAQFNNEIGIISSLYVCFRVKSNLFDKFLHYFLQLDITKNIINDFGEGGVRIYLWYDLFAKIPILVPTITEQKRITSFFSTIDRKITELKRKKNLLEQYKKGVMQKIFSQELRFKDKNGNNFPEWKLKKLGEVVKIIMGQSPSSKSYNSKEIGVPLIQGNADIQNRLSNPRNWTTEKSKECLKGDLILTVRAPVGNVAKSIHNACIGRGVCAIRNNSNSNIEYIYQFLLDYETKWISLEQGSTFTAVSGVEIKKLGIKFPSLAEQTIIANYLSAIDKKINYTQTQIEKAEIWKKGLLQKMYC